MRNPVPTQTPSNQTNGVDHAIGQIDLIGDSGGIVSSWRIRSSKCTIGSAPDCIVQLNFDDVIAIHATLVFGKKHTLLRSHGPTFISNRAVREWLIDEATEIVIGNSRMVVHPSIGLVATVVSSTRLIDQAAKLCKDPLPAKRDLANKPILEAVAASKLDSIEDLLRSLQSSLEKIQSALGTNVQNSNVAIVESVSQEIDEFGKKLFTNLNVQLTSQSGAQQSLITSLSEQFVNRLGAIDNQLNNHTGVQQMLISNLTDRFTDRFGSIDEQLSRFQESNSQHAIALQELLGQARSEQFVIESKFQQVISHRDELIEAVQVLRTEISAAHQSQLEAKELLVASEQVSVSIETPELLSKTCSATGITDDQLAHSLELAQVQIRELNSQLRDLTVERDSAQQRIESLSESWQAANSATDTPENVVNESPQYEAPLYEAAQYESPLYESPLYEAPLYEAAQYEAAQYEAPTDRSKPGRELPAWFKQDESEAFADQSSALYEPYDAYAQLETSKAPVVATDPEDELNTGEQANGNIEAISDRLQRMLSDTSNRRMQSTSAPVPSTTDSWSTKHGKVATLTASVPESNLELNDDSQYDRSAGQASGTTHFVEPTTSNTPSGSADPFPDAIRHLFREDTEAHSIVENGQQFTSEDRDASAQASRKQLVRPDDIDSVPPMARIPEEGSNEEESEESIELYMQRLLNRVRGGSESEAGKASFTEMSQTKTATQPTRNSRVAASLGIEPQDVQNLPPIEKISEELFVPRQQPTVQRNDLAALRELANTNARRAIHRSDIRRTNSAFYLKLGVTALAVSSAVGIFLINGLKLNAPFAGMVAAVVVAILWGVDCFNHFRRLRNGSGMAKVTAAEAASGQSIPVGSMEDNGWRPSPT